MQECMPAPSATLWTLNGPIRVVVVDEAGQSDDIYLGTILLIDAHALEGREIAADCAAIEGCRGFRSEIKSASTTGLIALTDEDIAG